MTIDNAKVDGMTLALLHLTTFKDKYGLRAWKSQDWGVLDRLHERLHPRPSDEGEVGNADGGRGGTVKAPG